MYKFYQAIVYSILLTFCWVTSIAQAESTADVIKYETLAKYGVIVLGFLLILAFWMMRLKREIAVRKRIEQTLSDSETRIRTIIDSALDAVVQINSEGIITGWNHQAENIFGWTDNEAIGRTISSTIIPLRYQDAQAQGIKRFLMTGDALIINAPFETQAQHRDGHEFPVELMVTPISIEGGREFNAFISDITKRKQAETHLRLAASVFTHVRECIMITDVDANIIDVNDTFTSITGYSRDEVLGKNPRIFQSGRQSQEDYTAMWSALTGVGYWQGEISNRHKDGNVYVELLIINAVRDEEGKTQHYVALFHDITPMKEYQQRLEHIAHYDALTGLANRVLLTDRLQQAMTQSQRRNQSLAVAFMDLDGFKAVNDNHGHAVGDELLIAVGRRMKMALREGDTLARIGGDEFVAVLVDLEQEQGYELVLTRLLRAASDPVTVNKTLLHVSASIGVTIYPQDDVDADQLMRHADQAMYVAKQRGKNRYHLFDTTQDVAIKIQRESLDHIRQALDQREFVLYYQPKVNMKTGEVIGAEALIRWQHRKRGLLLPADFLPIFENHPISMELGEWMMDTALTQISEWQAAGLNTKVSVNIGARQLQQQDFVAILSALLAKHPDVKPSSLEIEVSETSALEDVAGISAIMHACLELGVHFALDDFGTGYASLTYLRHLPVDILKIDQSFVRDMLDDSDDMAIVKGVIGLATAFRRQVIAEGVETIAHGAQLLSMGCVLAQGYGIARPMPSSDLPGWIANWKPERP